MEELRGRGIEETTDKGSKGRKGGQEEMNGEGSEEGREQCMETSSLRDTRTSIPGVAKACLLQDRDAAVSAQKGKITKDLPH